MPKAPATNNDRSRLRQSKIHPYSKSESQANSDTTTSNAKIQKKDPKQSHLYTDDNPATTLHGTGFKDAATAHHTIDLVAQRSLTYQWQVINTMHYRAKGHPSMKKGDGVPGIRAAMEVFAVWLNETYPTEKRKRQEEGRDFKPLLKKETVGRYLSRINALELTDDSEAQSDLLKGCKSFAEVYAALPKGKRLANILLDNDHPEKDDWEICREKALAKLKQQRHEDGEADLWTDNGGASDFHLQCIGWAWSPVGDKRLPP